VQLVHAMPWRHHLDVATLELDEDPAAGFMPAGFVEDARHAAADRHLLFLARGPLPPTCRQLSRLARVISSCLESLGPVADLVRVAQVDRLVVRRMGLALIVAHGDHLLSAWGRLDRDSNPSVPRSNLPTCRLSPIQFEGFLRRHGRIFAGLRNLPSGETEIILSKGGTDPSLKRQGPVPARNAPPSPTLQGFRTIHLHDVMPAAFCGLHGFAD
jgi:hypothetical protein